MGFLAYKVINLVLINLFKAPAQTPSGVWRRGLCLRRLWPGIFRIHAEWPRRSFAQPPESCFLLYFKTFFIRESDIFSWM